MTAAIAAATGFRFLLFSAATQMRPRRLRSERRGRQGGIGQALTLGKNRARIYSEQDIKVRFDDVAGIGFRQGDALVDTGDAPLVDDTSTPWSRTSRSEPTR